jgi:hypothetical protein
MAPKSRCSPDSLDRLELKWLVLWCREKLSTLTCRLDTARTAHRGGAVLSIYYVYSIRKQLDMLTRLLLDFRMTLKSGSRAV